MIPHFVLQMGTLPQSLHIYSVQQLFLHLRLTGCKQQADLTYPICTRNTETHKAFNDVVLIPILQGKWRCNSEHTGCNSHWLQSQIHKFCTNETSTISSFFIFIIPYQKLTRTNLNNYVSRVALKFLFHSKIRIH